VLGVFIIIIELEGGVETPDVAASTPGMGTVSTAGGGIPVA